MSPATTALALVMTLALLFTGCGTTQEPAKGSDDPVDTRLLGDGFRLDLTQRPSPTDLGLKEGDTIRVRNLPEEKTFDAQVVFDGGDTLRTPANVLIATAGTPDRPKNFQLVRNAMDLAAVRSALETAQKNLGLSPEDGATLLGVAEVAGRTGEFDNRTAQARPSGPDGLEINLIVDGKDEFHLIYVVTLAPGSESPSP